jgi:hypothetical protein
MLNKYQNLGSELVLEPYGFMDSISRTPPSALYACYLFSLFMLAVFFAFTPSACASKFVSNFGLFGIEKLW